jgi:hypothetical protein
LPKPSILDAGYVWSTSPNPRQIIRSFKQLKPVGVTVLYIPDVGIKNIRRQYINETQ